MGTHAAKDRAFQTDIGPVQVKVLPKLAGRFAHYLLYQTHPASEGRVLIGSGSADDTASCIAQAVSAARRAGQAG